ncbi:MAG: T9SS type A sorting domain-containing protein, partial [Bacteroidales bacterium]|nr:T9SS type A sorting domain-containing protein [Bacteroidales bacterium]
TDTNYIYIYGRRSESEYNLPYPHAARSAIGEVKSQNWEYYTRTGWSDDPQSTQRINSFQVSQQYSVSTYRGKYILLTQDVWLSPKIFSFTSASPVGPWSNKKHLYTTPETGGSTFTYNAWVHPQFDSNSEMLVSYNVNGDFWSIFSNVEIYRPRFIRIPYMNLDYDFWPNTADNRTLRNGFNLAIAPNPVSRNALVLLDLKEPQTLRLEMFTITGGLTMLQQEYKLTEGEHRITLDTDKMADGIYLLKVTAITGTQTIPLIKKSK